MAHISATPATTGMLIPKLSHRFVVKFSGTFDETDDCTLQQASKHLQALTMQLVTFVPPNEIFSPKQFNFIKMAHSAFRHFHADGPAIFTFEDDTRNEVQQALEFIARSDVTHLNALVMKVDSNELVLESFFFGSCKIKSIGHSALTYNSKGGIAGKFKASTDDKTPVTLSGDFMSHTSTSIEKKLTLDAIYTQRAIFKDPINITSLAPLILGI